MTETADLSPAERITSWIVSQGGTAPPPLVSAGSSAVADPPPTVVAPWGSVHTDPREQLSALEGDTNFRAAMMDGSHPGHAAALAAKTRLFQQIYGTEPASSAGGSNQPTIVDDGRGGYALSAMPTDDEEFDVAVRASSLALQRYEVPTSVAEALGYVSAELGLSPVLLADAAEEISTRGDRLTAEDARRELGRDADYLIERANVLISTVEGLGAFMRARPALGNSPKLVRLLADRAAQLGV